MGNDKQIEALSKDEKNFNPRSRVGNDFYFSRRCDRAMEFQSTFPRGERHSMDYYSGLVSIFQSTFPRGERR